ncbi:MAG: type III restriction endonuclease subunit R [Halobacteriovoraceae bacterium]|nr:type III restriction endonuclease subunit R [Halobacteriovoraceae bacterium]
MATNLKYISQRLSLRKPQKESLEILSKLTSSIDLNKETNKDEALEAFQKAGSFEKLVDFERGFPSVTFALATGVGKTRLMGAFISYLYKEKGLRNFLVLAPNLTIYNKLITDFSQETHPKYVFKGVQVEPRVITGDNYLKTNTVRYSQNRFGQSSLFDDEITINVFNISKINSEARGGKAPKIRRVSEYFGESYFQYLQNLDDLVLLMDESHHYRASRGMEVLNELNPILGLELTATPTLTNGTPFKNIVYEYTLAHAIQDGYVKEPAAATRKNLTREQLTSMSPEELDHMKIRDGIAVHEETKHNLEVYARNNKKPIVKPFVLIVAQDTTHATELKNFIQSDDFRNGQYKDKVFEIHSNQRGAEKEENIQKLLELEDPRNKYEIVIHCNMLKEGWDVTNLYTIIPLRTFAANILTEQTLGRGLRLPYGEKTGDENVDHLTVMAHESFESLIAAANNPHSIVMKQFFVDPDDEIFKKNQEVVTSRSQAEEEIEAQQKEIEQIEDEEERNKAKAKIEVQRVILAETTNSDNVIDLKDLSKDEVKEKIKETVKSKVKQGVLFTNVEDVQIEEFFEEKYEKIIESVISKTIEIPRITIQLKNETEFGFKDFDLDCSNMPNYSPVAEEIFVRYLQDQEKTHTHSIANSDTSDVQSWQNTIVNELLNYDEIDYDEQVDLLYKLAEKAVSHFKSYLKDDAEVDNVIKYNKQKIAEFIYTQMNENVVYNPGEFESAEVLPFTRIEEHNYTKFKEEDIHKSRDHVATKVELTRRVYDYYQKSCHTFYKYDSLPEKELASLLDEDKTVLKWLRPSPRQFNIYWNHGVSNYEPDIVVESEDCHYIIEVKAKKDMSSSDVIDKAKAAAQYCKIASDYNKKHGKKPWKYLIIPHDEITSTRDLSYFTSFEFKNDL